jgi:hypothetical protein
MENQRFSRGILYHKPILQRREKSSIMVWNSRRRRIGSRARRLDAWIGKNLSGKFAQAKKSSGARRLDTGKAKTLWKIRASEPGAKSARSGANVLYWKCKAKFRAKVLVSVVYKS